MAGNESRVRHRRAAPDGTMAACPQVALARFTDPLLTGPAALARHVVDAIGGRYSAGLGIDVDAGDTEVERWFLGASLFGARISAGVAERTFRVLDQAGLRRMDQARHVPSEQLVELLDAGGYTRYDFRTAARLQELAEIIDERYAGQVAEIGRSYPSYPELRGALTALPGWGPVTVQLFLRELRGVWPGAQPPLDRRAAFAASHICLVPAAEPATFAQIAGLAADAGLDVRDLESGLVRLALAHRRTRNPCPGGARCRYLPERH